MFIYFTYYIYIIYIRSLYFYRSIAIGSVLTWYKPYDVNRYNGGINQLLTWYHNHFPSCVWIIDYYILCMFPYGGKLPSSLCVIKPYRLHKIHCNMRGAICWYISQVMEQPTFDTQFSYSTAMLLITLHYIRLGYMLLHFILLYWIVLHSIP